MVLIFPVCSASSFGHTQSYPLQVGVGGGAGPPPPGCSPSKGLQQAAAQDPELRRTSCLHYCSTTSIWKLLITC